MPAPVVTRRGRTVSLRVIRGALERDAPAEPQEQDAPSTRPRTRGECAEGPRPCPWCSCRHHLLVDINKAGSLCHNFDFDGARPGVDDYVRGLESMRETCALDVADRGAATLEEIGDIVRVSRERVRQLEEIAMRKLKRQHPWLADSLEKAGASLRFTRRQLLDEGEECSMDDEQE